MITPEEQERAKAAAAKMLAMQLFALEVDRARLAVVMSAMEWFDDETITHGRILQACEALKALELRGPLPPEVKPGP